MATNLTTLQRVKRYAKLADDYTADDAVLLDLLAAVSQEVREYCRQDFDMALFEETYNGSGNRWIQLAQVPIREVVSLSVGGRNVSESDGFGPGYIIDERGLYNPLGYWPCQVGAVKVSYVAGYDSVPEDVQQHVVYTVVLRYRRRETIGLVSRANGASTDSYDTIDLPESVKAALDKYIEPDHVLPSRSKKTAPWPPVPPVPTP